MKKIVILAALLLLPAFGVFADSAEFFTFSLGAGGGYDMVSGNISAGTTYGVDYYFNSSFSGGFKFFKLSAGDVAAVCISVSPAENMSVNIYTGADAASNVVFGAGIGYDFFTKKDRLFSGLGIFVDWLAGTAGPYDVTSGGTFTFGLNTRFGL